MSTNRIYIGSDRVTVSKPGYDAVSPPAVDYKYLALDSRLDSGRPLEIGFIPNYTFGNSVNFAQSYPLPPAVEIFFITFTALGTSFNKSVVIRDDNGTTAFERTSYLIAVTTTGFFIGDQAVNYRSSLFGQVRPMFYIAWKVRP